VVVLVVTVWVVGVSDAQPPKNPPARIASATKENVVFIRLVIVADRARGRMRAAANDEAG